MVPGADDVPAEVTSSGEHLPASCSGLDFAPVMTPGDDSDSDHNLAEVNSLGDNLPSQYSGTETAAMHPETDLALVACPSVQSKEDDSRSYSDYLTWTNRRLITLLKEAKREATQQFVDALSKL